MTHATRDAASSRPVVRSPRFSWATTPRRWLAGSTAATHIANGVNLLFPHGERFFVRSVRHYLRDVDDATLAEDVRAFFGQEGRHAGAHEAFFDVLREQGYEVDAFLVPYKRLSDRIEKASPPALRLAVTAALEHFTAILAEDALDGRMFEVAHPTVARLLAWHAVEELEHKAVAFDVLARVAPSYFLRVAGMFLGAALLGSFWIMATRELLRQDGMSLVDAAGDLRALRERGEAAGLEPQGPIATRVFLRGIREYLRPGFHPNDRDHRELIARTLALLETEGVVEARRAA